MENLYRWNETLYQWEKVTRVQEYRGCKIETLSTHDDNSDPVYHREYRITYPSGRVTQRVINKREGGNIKDIKQYIDFKIKYNEEL